MTKVLFVHLHGLIQTHRPNLYLIEFLETDGGSIFSKTLPAHIQSVFSDDTMFVGTRSARPGTLSVFFGMTIPNVGVTHFVK